ncbi:unnamed protein product [Caenorhabditis brenneri]
MTTTCPHNTTYLASIEFLETGCHIGSLFMITLSSYSLFLIAKKSPTTMKSSVPYMINLHLWTMFCDLTWAVLVLPMFFMPVIAAHSSGILLYVTENQTFLLWICFASLGGMCAGIMSLFEHRHQVIVTNSWFVMKRKWTRRIFFTILYFTLVNFGIPEILTVPEDQETEKLKAFHRYPCIPVIIFEKMSRVLQSDASLFNPHMYLTCASLGGLCCFYCSHIMWNLLPRNNPSMSRSTRKMLISFFISMCIQVAIPVVVIYIPNIYWNVSITFDFHSQELNNISIVLFTLHGTSSSIATIFIYSPYRKFTKELLLYGILKLPVSRVSPLVVSVTDRSTGRTAAPTI